MLTESDRRRDFPALDGLHYLNTAAESIPPINVGQALQSYWQDKQLGMKGRDAHFAKVNECREVASRWLQLSPDEVSFCSCSSEAYNLLASALDLEASNEVVINDLDFPAGVTPWLTHRRAPQLRLWKSANGELNLDDLQHLLSPRTRLVQLSQVSFYNGHRIDWPQVAALVRKHAPQAVLALDVTQALGRVPVDSRLADITISSTHKWTLGLHGGCIIGVPMSSSQKVTTHAGGWYHIENAFGAERFERAEIKPGAQSFAVGMPNFAAIYGLNAALRYLESQSLAAIEQHANPLIEKVYEGLIDLGLKPMCPWKPQLPSGIVAFQHTDTERIYSSLIAHNIHVMHHAGRIRIAVHGYNSAADITALLEVLHRALRK